MACFPEKKHKPFVRARKAIMKCKEYMLGLPAGPELRAHLHYQQATLTQLQLMAIGLNGLVGKAPLQDDSPVFTDELEAAMAAAQQAIQGYTEALGANSAKVRNAQGVLRELQAYAQGLAEQIWQACHTGTVCQPISNRSNMFQAR